MTIQSERCNSIAYGLYDGRALVGFALQLANNKWGWFDTKDVRQSPLQFRNPKAVAAFVDGKMTRGKPALLL